MWKVSEERVAFPGCTPPRYLYIRFIKYIRTTKRALKYIHFYLSYIYIWYSWWMMESIEEYSYRRRLLVDQLAGDLGWSWSPTSYALRSRQGQNRMCFHFRYLSSNLTWRNGDITQVSLNKRQKGADCTRPSFRSLWLILYFHNAYHLSGEIKMVPNAIVTEGSWDPGATDYILAGRSKSWSSWWWGRRHAAGT